MMRGMAAGRERGVPRLAGDRERWIAVQRRDPRADDRFFYSVSTTGVYCRPTCPARRPRREHVRFHDTRDEAEQAGFRPCRRCRPDGPRPADRHVRAVARACRTIETSYETPTLAMLAEEAGMSRFHFHRLFKAATGVTPRAYAAAHRNGRMRAALASSATVTEAIYEAGFSSSGRFYASSTAALGMSPAAFRAGGNGMAIRFAIGTCSLGAVLVAATGRGVCAILLGDRPEPLVQDLKARFPRASIAPGDRAFEGLVDAVIRLVERPDRRGADLPLDVRGTAFQQRVWLALREIPAGTTVSYAELARRAGAPRAVRAVAAACAANPLAVAIPCHRAVAQDGSLAGYRWGLERKRTLLARETR